MILVLISKSVNEHYDVPYNVSPAFTGREDICRKLRESCLPTVPHNAQKVQKRFVLYGMVRTCWNLPSTMKV